MENLGVFVNTLTANDKYSLLNRDSYNANNSDAVIGENTFFWVFLQVRLNFKHFEKKR